MSSQPDCVRSTVKINTEDRQLVAAYNLVFGGKQFTKQFTRLINFLIGQLGFVLASYFFQARLSFLCRMSVEILPNVPRETYQLTRPV